MAKAKRMLQAPDIRRCFDAYTEVISGINGVRLTNDMATRIQYPKLPSECTQALLRDLVVCRHRPTRTRSDRQRRSWRQRG